MARTRPTASGDSAHMANAFGATAHSKPIPTPAHTIPTSDMTRAPQCARSVSPAQFVRVETTRHRQGNLTRRAWRHQGAQSGSSHPTPSTLCHISKAQHAEEEVCHDQKATDKRARDKDADALDDAFVEEKLEDDRREGGECE